MDGVRPEVEDSAEADSGDIPILVINVQMGQAIFEDIPILVINVQMGQAIFEGAFMAATRSPVRQLPARLSSLLCTLKRPERMSTLQLERGGGTQK